MREITVNSQPFTTEYEYYDGTDKLKTETQCGASCMLDIGDERYYAYAKQNGRGFYYRDTNGNKIGSFHAFLIGLPSVWSRYLFILVMAMVPVLLFGPAVKRLLFCYGEPTRLRLRVPRKSICVLLAFLIFIGPDGFESLAQAEVQYANLGTSSWGQADRTIEYTYNDNGSLLTKTTKVTSTQAVEETVTYDHNLANRLDKVTTELANGDQHIVEYTYNDEGIRVSAYSYDIPYSQGVQNEKTVIYLTDSYNHTGYAQTLEELVFDYANPDPLTETPDSLTTYLIGDDVLAQNVDGTTQYLLYDGHGSTRQLAEYDTSVSIAETFSYDAYGVLLQDQADVVKPGYTQQQQTNLLYSGEYFDTDVQQYYLRARWYNPFNGRFNRVDPFSGSLQDPQSLHKYLYCHNNPVNGIDPSGKFITVIGQLCTWAIQKIVRGIDATRAYATGLYIKTKLATSTLLWQLYFGYRYFVDLLYHFATRVGRFLIRIPQTVWQRVSQVLSRSPNIISPSEAARGGFSGPEKLVRAWRHLGASGDIHHLVMRTPKNVARFGARAIHSFANSIPVPHSWHSKIIHSFTQSSPASLGLDPGKYGHVSHMYQYFETCTWEVQYRWGAAIYNYLVENGNLLGFNPADYHL